MEIEFKMPDLATTDSAIKVIRWFVEVGQPVKRGQPLLEVETDKAAMEVESIATGKLSAVHVQPGGAVAVGQTIAMIATEGGIAVPPPVSLPTQLVPAVAPAASPSALPKKAGGMFAKNRAAAQKPATGEQKPSIALSPAQRTVARRMQESKQTIPHFYLQTSVNAERMITRRTAAAPVKIAWDAFFVYAVGRALKKFDRMGLRFEADHLVPSGADAVGVAVDHAGELYVIAIVNPAEKTPEQISGEIRALVEKLRAGDSEAKKLRPANVTITNLGGANVETFTAIVNPPESSILAIGKIAPVAVVQGGGIVPQHRVSITLSADHRVVNGKYAADFLGAVVQELESL
ncbi:MAG: 2-oxo acid dehydrogenase subunit E2 [Opitutaceae bacterium]|nr:2-oxo acid dehydrogenase subunit E2 [Opitutaceae bacterium]